MRAHAIACLALVLLPWLAGCAALRGVMNPSGRLLEQARAAVELKDLDTAYRRLAEIRREYPGSAESREAFPLAAAIFQKSYFRDRYAQPDSQWLTREPGFSSACPTATSRSSSPSWRSAARVPAS